ncbi:MAG: tRNA (N(6)-L-threonylcarbamoyladenosine(37)-C(2))-methylthiotransferase MtaB [Chthonomonadales bacterium]
MPTAAFVTLGCKVNQYETQRIIDRFEERGFAITGASEAADVYVVNSCSVTQTAERKSRQILRRLRRQNPNAIVVMTGCYAEMARIKGDALNEAALVVPNHQKMNTLDHLLDHFPHLAPVEPTPPFRSNPIQRTRATVKIQDGCDVFCSFCSIPFTRSVLASRPASEVVREIEELSAQGYTEVVLTGVLVGSYGPATGSGGPDLPELLRRIASIPSIRRIRLSSIEPTQVTPALLNVFAAEPKVCKHLHIPLQSGDTRILRAMNRPYTRDGYLELCRKALSLIPDLGITTDIMVGFPGEDEAAFQNTLDVVEQVGFARAHIFRFSPRPGTPAAEMPGMVPDDVKEVRSHRLASACSASQYRFIKRFLGRTMDVLVEGKERTGGMPAGYTHNYIRVSLAGGSHLAGRIVPVRLLEIAGDGAQGEAVSDAVVGEGALTAPSAPVGAVSEGYISSLRAGAASL